MRAFPPRRHLISMPFPRAFLWPQSLPCLKWLQSMSNYSQTLIAVSPPSLPGVPPAPGVVFRNSSHVTIGWGVTLANGGCALTSLAVYQAVPTWVSLGLCIWGRSV